MDGKDFSLPKHFELLRVFVDRRSLESSTINVSRDTPFQVSNFSNVALVLNVTDTYTG
jgi:hypothetical protein